MKKKIIKVSATPLKLKDLFELGEKFNLMDCRIRLEELNGNQENLHGLVFDEDNEELVLKPV